jgi:hypothetical protein
MKRANTGTFSMTKDTFFGENLARISFALASLPKEDVQTVTELVELVCNGAKMRETENVLKH